MLCLTREGRKLPDREAPDAPYRHIYETLRERIVREELRPGDRLPSSRELMVDFQAANHTVQRALRELKDARLVRSVPAKGTFVCAVAETVERSDAYTRPPLPGQSVPYKAKSRIVEVGPVPAPTYVAVRMGISAGDEVVLRKRHMERDGKVIEIVSSYYPRDVAEGTELAREAPLRGGSPAALERLGFGAQGHPDEWVFTRLPLLSEARLLDMPMSSPVFRLLRTVFSADARPVEVIEMVMDGERSVLRYSL